MMFSATLSKEIRPVCKKFMQDPMEVYVDDEAKLTLHGLRDVGLGAAPGRGSVHGGAAGVDNTLVSEGEDALAPGGGAGGGGDGLAGTGAGGRGGAVPPLVGHNLSRARHLSCTPGDGGVSIGALVVLHPFVGEWKDTRVSCQS